MTRIRFISFLIAALAVLSAWGRTVDQIPNVHLTDPDRYVSDPDHFLTPEQIARADAIIKNVWQQTGAELVAVVVADTDGMDIDSYATEIFDKWRIGKSDRDNGILVVVAVNDRKMALRTGYGAEGVLPDAVLGRIRRDEMQPEFAEGRYGEGLINGLSAISAIVTEPENADYLRSEHANDENARPVDDDSDDAFRFWLILGCVCLIVLSAVIISRYNSTKSLERHERFERLRSLNTISLVLSVFFLGIPLPAWLLLRLLMKKVRRSVPSCSNCGHKMHLIDEEHDNDYLTPSQDAEERLDSVDYDVWVCDDCNNVEIHPYVNHSRPFTVCPKCGARAVEMVSNKVAVAPTTKSEGVGVKTFVCRHCGYTFDQNYRIPRKPEEPSGNAVAGAVLGAALGAALGGRGGGFGGGGGGFSGGSFGGGRTGGGGSSGSW